MIYWDEKYYNEKKERKKNLQTDPLLPHETFLNTTVIVTAEKIATPFLNLLQNLYSIAIVVYYL